MKKQTYKITDKENNLICYTDLIIKHQGINCITFRKQKNRAILLGEYGPIVISHVIKNTMYGHKLDTWSGNLSYGNYDLMEVINFELI